MSNASYVRPASPASSTTSHGTSHTRRATFPLSHYDPDMAFQINPLSFHPPRTPQPSIVSQPEMYNNAASHYSEKSGYDRQPEPSVKDDSSEIGGRSLGIRQTEIWRDMIAASNGRDKALVRKCLCGESCRWLTSLSETHSILTQVLSPAAPDTRWRYAPKGATTNSPQMGNITHHSYNTGHSWSLPCKVSHTSNPYHVTKHMQKMSPTLQLARTPQCNYESGRLDILDQFILLKGSSTTNIISLHERPATSSS
jgi:hypothetical protein